MSDTFKINEDDEIGKAVQASIKESENSIITHPIKEINLSSTGTDCKSAQDENKNKTVSSTPTSANEEVEMPLDVKEVDDLLDHFNNNDDVSVNTMDDGGKSVIKKQQSSPQKKSKRMKSMNQECEDKVSSFSEEEGNCDLEKGDFDYTPGKLVKMQTRKRSFRSIAPKKDAALTFDCTHCIFSSMSLGELKIHRHLKHGSESPSYLDMAEASIVKLQDASELAIFEVLFDYFDTITDHKTRASQLLSKALKGGVKIGRLEVSGGRRKGTERYGLAPMEKMKEVVKRWRKSERSVEYVDDNLDRGRRSKKVIKMSENSSSTTTVPGSQMISVKPKLKPVGGRKIVKVTQVQTPVIKVETPEVPPPPVSYESDQDDPSYLLTCPVCYCSYWYQNQTVKHIKEKHPFHNCVEQLLSFY